MSKQHELVAQTPISPTMLGPTTPPQVVWPDEGVIFDPLREEKKAQA